MQLGGEPRKISDSALGQVIADLDLLNRSTERDFLAVGEKLGVFIAEVTVISTRLTALADMISGAHGVSTSQSLKVAFDLFSEMKARYKGRTAGLGCMGREAARLRQGLAGFGEVVANLHAIGVLTRIEIARLGSTGTDFGSLAEDMTTLTSHVQAKVKIALETGALLIPPIELAMLNIAILDREQGKDLSGAFDTLSAFREIQEKAREASARLAARYEFISAGFRKLMISLQFHDMTRQQIEHVIEVLKRLYRPPGSDSIEDSGNVRITAAVLGLQSSQLALAAQKFAASAATVSSGLDDIADHVAEMSEESKCLSGASTRQPDSFFLQMERGCTAILVNLQRLVQADLSTQITGNDIEEDIGRMRGSIEEIRRIELQLKRMALNASIVATRIGGSGDGIHALALSMREQALDSGAFSESLVQILGSLSQAAIRMFGQSGVDAMNRRTGQDACVEGMLTAVAELHTSGERSIARIAEIVTGGGSLLREISSTRQAFLVGPLFARAISRSRQMLQDVAGTIQADLPQEGEGLSDALGDFTTNYTMQSQRAVHEGASAQPDGEAAGDVEFF
jgi:methyl-accepting chemotaxis protein